MRKIMGDWWGTRRRLALLALVLLVLAPPAWVGLKLLRMDNSAIWAVGYFQNYLAGEYRGSEKTTDLILLVCDHWEPGSGEAALQRSRRWLLEYPKVPARHQDSQGRPFQYTWFYPIDNLEPQILEMLSEMAARGLGEVEVHWHHHHESEADFRRDLEAGLAEFRRVGATVSKPGGPSRWGFAHGNWALDAGNPGCCGIANEISIIQEMGCYGDFTFPALGSPAQPKTINQIYYAVDTSEPKSHDTGLEAMVGRPGEGLLIFEGPMGMNFRNPLLLMEGAAIDASEGTGFIGMIRPPANFRDYFQDSRVPLWRDMNITVAGRPEWCFVKLHAHGHENADLLLGGQLDAMLDAVAAYCREQGLRWHYVTTREAYNLVKAAENGLSGNPADYYDYEVPRPLNVQPRWWAGR